MQHAVAILTEFGVAHEAQVILGAPHAGPDVRLRRDCARERGRAIIAGARAALPTCRA